MEINLERKLPILITGFSTRSIAEAALRSGYSPLTLDYFGDYDQRLLVKNYSLMRDLGLPFSIKNVLAVFKKIKEEIEALIYISPFENHPQAVRKLSSGIMLLGNTPETLKKVRNWRFIRAFTQEEGIGFPETIFPDEELPQSGSWLLKPERSGGGHRIKLWQGEELKKGYFLQKLVKGVPCSAVFAADGKNSVLLGLTEQLIGKPELGAEGFTWCGNIFPLELDQENREALISRIDDICLKLTRSFGLRGINGIDFVLSESENTPFLVEVNPRYPASMELIEQAFHLPAFEIHIQSSQGESYYFPLKEKLSQARYHGKGIVYAKQTVEIPPESPNWILANRRDVPFPGEIVKKGHPICTVFATGETRDECWWGLLQEAERLEKELKPFLAVWHKEKEEWKIGDSC